MMKPSHYFHLALLLIPCIVGMACNWYLFFWENGEQLSVENSPTFQNNISEILVTPTSLDHETSEIERTMKHITEETAHIKAYLRGRMVNNHEIDEEEDVELSDANNEIASNESDGEMKPSGVTYMKRHGSSFAIIATYMHSQTAALKLILLFEGRQCCCFWNLFVKWIYPIYISWEVPIYVVLGIFYLVVIGKDCPVAGISITVAGTFALVEVVCFWVTMCRDYCRIVVPKRDQSNRVYALLAIQGLFFVARYMALYFAMKQTSESLMLNFAESVLLVGSILINVRHLMHEVGTSSKIAFLLLSGGEVSAITSSFAIACFYAFTVQIEGLVPAMTVLMITVDVVVYQWFAPPIQRNGTVEDDQLEIVNNEMKASSDV